MKKKSYSKFRLEELPIVADLLLYYLDRDRSAFLGFSNKFDDSFSDQIRIQILTVRSLIPARVITSEKVKVTEDLYQKMDVVDKKLNFVQAYADLANETMDINSKDFGIRKCKQQLKARNVEGALSKLNMVEQNIDGNLIALQAKGFKNDLLKEIVELHTDIAELNLLQEQKNMERKELVDKNHKEYEKLWNCITEISRMGKLLMRDDQLKMNDYKLCELIKHVRKSR